MRRTVCALVLATLLDAAAALPSGGDKLTHLALTISAKSLDLRVGEPPVVRAEITNWGSEPVVLVLPGDRSDSGGRTPIIGWEIRVIRQDSDPGPKPLLLHCGNVNPLRRNEVFTLRPGESRDLGPWVNLHPFRAAGVYAVQFQYENQPMQKWTGLPLGPHDAEAMESLRKSTPCILASNYLTFTVR